MSSPAVRDASSTPHLTVAEAASCARRGADQIVTLLRQAKDPAARATADWTVRDIAAHVAVGMTDYFAIVHGEGSPIDVLGGMPAFNANVVAVETEQDLAVLASRIEVAFSNLLTVQHGAQEDTTVPWHGGVPIPLASAIVTTAGEAYIHGLDIARAWGMPYAIPAMDARLIARGLVPVLPALVDAEGAGDVRARILLRLRGGDDRWLLTFHDGTLAVSPPDGLRVDCTIWADPVAFMLSSYSRIGPLHAALRGQVIAWGRRPQLAFRLSSYLISA